MQYQLCLNDNTDELSKARQSFDPTWPVHYLGKMDVMCKSCNAYHWMDEKLAKSSKKNPVFGICCTSGKIKLLILENLSMEIQRLLSDQDQHAKKFHEHIQKYNNALAMTLLSCKVDDSVNRNSARPYVFKVHGKISHKTGALLSNDGDTPLYSQFYIYDRAEALQYHMDHAANHDFEHQCKVALYFDEGN